jgi:hypothetical protein
LYSAFSILYSYQVNPKELIPMSHQPRSRRSTDYGAALWIACFNPQAGAKPTVVPALTDAEQPHEHTVQHPTLAAPPLPLHKRVHWRPRCA